LDVAVDPFGVELGRAAHLREHPEGDQQIDRLEVLAELAVPVRALL
jgi:hypothetical protein